MNVLGIRNVFHREPTFLEKAQCCMHRAFDVVLWPAYYVLARYMRGLDWVTLKVGASLFIGLLTAALTFVLYITHDVLCQRVRRKMRNILSAMRSSMGQTGRSVKRSASNARSRVRSGSFSSSDSPPASPRRAAAGRKRGK